MMYFLDFDRTVFNTEAFYEYLKTHPVASEHEHEPDQRPSHMLSRIVEEGKLVFAPGELSQFLYEDAARFLRDKENGVMLITFGNPAFQRAKVESALTGIPRISTMYTGDVRKGEFIAPHIRMYGATPVFADDSVIELEILEAKCPGARLFEMRRDGAAGDGRWSVLTQLNDLV